MVEVNFNIFFNKQQVFKQLLRNREGGGDPSYTLPHAE